MSHSYRDDQSLNPAVAGNEADQPSFTQVLQARWSRRDVLVGGAGNDSLTGGSGIDTFTVDIGTDTITDLGVGGADVLTVALGATAYATVGAAWTATAASVNNGTEYLSSAGYKVDLSGILTGNGFSVTNTEAAVSFTGSSGNDTLIGGVGNDT